MYTPSQAFSDTVCWAAGLCTVDIVDENIDAAVLFKNLADRCLISAWLVTSAWIASQIPLAAWILNAVRRAASR